VEQQEITARLRRVEGQIRGLQRMINEGQDCEAVITQLLAARAALDKVTVSIATGYIQECLRGLDVVQAGQRIGRTVELAFKLTPLAQEVLNELNNNIDESKD
jgi:DNA-binding FrmR family transcriptional regulator